jgi:hypothetical protein
MAIVVLPVNFLAAKGSFEPELKENNSTLEEIMSIFDEDYQFTVFETMKEEYEDRGVYELYINNDYIFSGNFMLLCGGEPNSLFDFKHYNFVVPVPKDVFMNFHRGMTVSKQTLMELLDHPFYRAEVTELDFDNFDIEQFLGIFSGQGDEDIVENINQNVRNYVHHTMTRQTLKEKNEDFTRLLLLMMLMGGV